MVENPTVLFQTANVSSLECISQERIIADDSPPSEELSQFDNLSESKDDEMDLKCNKKAEETLQIQVRVNTEIESSRSLSGGSFCFL